MNKAEAKLDRNSEIINQRLLLLRQARHTKRKDSCDIFQRACFSWRTCTIEASSRHERPVFRVETLDSLHHLESAIELVEYGFYRQRDMFRVVS
jgi:hypothetical protein